MAEETRGCSNTGCTESSCEGCSHKQQSFLEETHPMNNIKKVIGVVSGKGGVGKSMVAASLAVNLKNRGYKVGIMDADITGPSIPKMFGIHGKAEACEEGLIPTAVENGLKIMSVNLLLENEDDPVIWRGPVISGLVKQFWTETIWGDLDYLLIDMPPGTGDVPLTIYQSIPLDGVIIVTSPQELVQLIVKKAYHMAEAMNIPVLGVVENFSYVKCPDCGKEIKVFGESNIESVAKDLNIEVLGRMPIEPELAGLSDSGEFTKLKNSYLDKAVEVIEKK